jgi:transcriptional regulator with XRE-family HTH domain
MVSSALRLEVLRQRSRGVRQYALARAAGLHPTVLSALINGAIDSHPGDARVLRLAAVLGVPAEQAFGE